ncbi:hypothetical protein CAL12_19275 [Bordetella genomosp. 8]|uniref:Uncharacterized protein n=2 Tax=Bordetella genomosp. 8 TaxID=1416806 RepID=A0A1W6YNT1_9BORD|nr:hypothetical protein CAL12_19275 [Bordetella genomosp. 8]
MATLLLVAVFMSSINAVAADKADKNPKNKSAGYVLTWINTQANTITLNRSSVTCMYNPGDASIQLNTGVPKPETLEDNNGVGNCLNAPKIVAWTVSTNGALIYFRHELVSGIGSSWITQIVDTSGTVKSATCLQASNENGHNCLNQGVTNVVGIDVVF